MDRTGNDGNAAANQSGSKLNQYGWVIADLQGKIRGNWDPPSDLGGGNVRRRSVQIQLTLLPDGSIRNPTIVQSSGNGAVDESVIRAITTLRERIMPPKETLDFILDFNLY